MHSSLPILRREVHAAQQGLKAVLGAQAIQNRGRVNKDHPLVVLFVSPLQPRDRLVCFAEANVRLGEEKAGDITMPGRFSQFVDQVLRLTLPSFEPIDTGHGSKAMRVPPLRWVA